MTATGLAGALRRGPAWFLARADPGLGRLTETIALMEEVRREGSEALLLTSPTMVPTAARLGPGPVRPFELGRGEDPQQALIDSRDLHRLLRDLRRERPRALVVHGYPILLPWLRGAGGLQLLAIANRHDLRSPGHSPGARLLAERLHQSADLVITGELRRGWRRGRVGEAPLIRLPGLVRPHLLSRPPTAERGVVAAMGGGSRGDRALARSTAMILDGLEQGVRSGAISGCRVFPGEVLDPVRHPHLEGGTIADWPRALAEARVVVARAGRSTLAELLALGKRAVVVPAASDTLRALEQAENARRAAALSAAVVVLDPGRASEIGRACALADTLVPDRWPPGNRVLWRALEAPVVLANGG